jgi:ubiquinone/menaquinone biosynthesis C-methylase UbiE
LSKKAIEFCNKNYSIESINFLQENAQDLSFQDQSFDIEISVESAHRYSHMDTFLYEVYRVLKPGGFFLFTDFGSETELEKLKTQLKNSNLQLVKDKNITYNVVKALTLATPSRDKLIKKLMPKFLQYLSKNFAGTEGTPTYNKFLAREYEYVFYVLTK